MAVHFSFPKSMRNDSNSFAVLAYISQTAHQLFFDDVILDFSNTDWFEANLCSPLGAVLTQISGNLNSIQFYGLTPKVENILRKNEFLTYYGGTSLIDSYGTAIKYAPFASHDHILFNKYLDQNLFTKNLPQMSLGLVKEIKRSINEVFGNASTHGKSERIFACGQYFPYKQRIDFTIANLGVTFQENVFKFLKRPISDVDAIDWATKKGNTTRVGPIPGGLGLFTLLSFLQLNKGRLQIISGNGYWLFDANGVLKQSISHNFQGAIINIEFKVDDPRTYLLSTELDQQNIF